jgi:hypothetical protein
MIRRHGAKPAMDRPSYQAPNDKGPDLGRYNAVLGEVSAGDPRLPVIARSDRARAASI